MLLIASRLRLTTAERINEWLKALLQLLSLNRPALLHTLRAVTVLAASLFLTTRVLVMRVRSIIRENERCRCGAALRLSLEIRVRKNPFIGKVKTESRKKLFY